MPPLVARFSAAFFATFGASVALFRTASAIVSGTIEAVVSSATTASTAAASAPPAHALFVLLLLSAFGAHRGFAFALRLGLRVFVFLFAFGFAVRFLRRSFHFGHRRRLHLRTLLLRLSRLRHRHILKFFLLVLFLEEIGHVKERVALQSNVHKGRLHAGKHARNAPFVDGAGQAVFVFALEVNFCELVVLLHRHLGFVRRGGDK
jgi:hypothetical protein